MPRFIVTGCYSAESMKGMMKTPSDRGAAAKVMVEASGGKMEAFYATTGATDFILIASTDDVTDLLAGLMVVGGSGAVTNLQTQRAFDAAEFTAIQKKAGWDGQELQGAELTHAVTGGSC